MTTTICQSKHRPLLVHTCCTDMRCNRFTSRSVVCFRRSPPLFHQEDRFDNTLMATRRPPDLPEPLSLACCTTPAQPVPRTFPIAYASSILKLPRPSSCKSGFAQISLSSADSYRTPSVEVLKIRKQPARERVQVQRSSCSIVVRIACCLPPNQVRVRYLITDPIKFGLALAHLPFERGDCSSAASIHLGVTVNISPIE